MEFRRRVLFFPAAQHAGIRDGSVTVSFRAWDRPRVKAGSMQRSHPLGVLAIDEVRLVRLAEVTEEDARRAGHEGRKALTSFVREKLGSATGKTTIYRLAFRYVGDADFAPTALDDRLGPDDVRHISASLRKADAAAPSPWTAATLDLIAAHPRVVASQLAALAGRERAAFKADVVKLKKLGLTRSFSVGYELSPRGIAYREATRSRSTRARNDGSKTPSTRIE